MRIAVRVTGGTRIAAAFSAIEAGMRQGAEEAVLIELLALQGDAKRAAPIDDGRLRGSITVVRAEDRMSGTVGPNVHYGKHVEFGTGLFAANGEGRKTPWVYKHPKYGFVRTSGNRPQPYLLPSFEAAKRRFPERLRQRILARTRGAG